MTTEACAQILSCVHVSQDRRDGLAVDLGVLALAQLLHGPNPYVFSVSARAVGVRLDGVAQNGAIEQIYLEFFDGTIAGLKECLQLRFLYF